MSLIKKTLGWKPKWTFEKGMQDLIEWGEIEKSVDLFDLALEKLKSRGLIKS